MVLSISNSLKMPWHNWINYCCDNSWI